MTADVFVLDRIIPNPVVSGEPLTAAMVHIPTRLHYLREMSLDHQQYLSMLKAMSNILKNND